ncbi:MAG: cytochrome c [Ginsengibacter sp.]
MRIFLILLFLFAVISLHAQTVTFNKDIAPIIESKCVSCHKPGESAPFNLLTYDDVAKRATFIAKVVQSKYMPPWKADDTYTHFANNRSLSDEQIKKISDWVKAGTPKGDKPDYEIKSLDNTTFSRNPDLTLTVKNAYKVQGDNKERFIVFKIPFELPQDYNVEAIEFFSNNKKLIHHANYAVHPVTDTSIDIYKTADLINLTDDDRTKYAQYFPYKKTIAYYGGWIPGTSYEQYPPGFGWVMPKRGVILLTIHYSPLAKEAESISGINLFFTKDSIKRKIKVISLGSGGIGEKDITPEFHNIPANKISTYKLEIVNPKENESVFYVWPHMHLIGKTFKAYAVFGKNNDTIPLVNIPDWDFRWQEIYRFKKPVLIPIGSKLVIEASYDNTSNNPFNPNDPPKVVTSEGDMRSDQEMMTLLMLYVPYEDGDENIDLDNFK